MIVAVADTLVASSSGVTLRMVGGWVSIRAAGAAGGALTPPGTAAVGSVPPTPPRDPGTGSGALPPVPADVLGTEGEAGIGRAAGGAVTAVVKDQTLSDASGLP